MKISNKYILYISLPLIALVSAFFAFRYLIKDRFDVCYQVFEISGDRLKEIDRGDCIPSHDDFFNSTAPISSQAGSYGFIDARDFLGVMDIYSLEELGRRLGGSGSTVFYRNQPNSAISIVDVVFLTSKDIDNHINLRRNIKPDSDVSFYDIVKGFYEDGACRILITEPDRTRWLNPHAFVLNGIIDPHADNGRQQLIDNEEEFYSCNFSYIYYLTLSSPKEFSRTEMLEDFYEAIEIQSEGW